MKRTLLPFAAVLFSAAMFAQTYSNGPLSTGATSSNGTAAPSGYTWSELQVNNTTLGSGATLGNNLADDFVVPANEKWSISTIDFFGYQTGATTQPFSKVFAQIHNGDPSTGGAVVAGNLSTNVMTAATDGKMYRTAQTGASFGTTRRIWKLTATLNAALQPGTYWVQFTTETTNGNAAFFPPVTVVGQPAPAGANAKQYGSTGVWQDLMDTGSNTQQAVPFVITYTVQTMGVDETRQYDNRIVVYPNPTSDSFKLNLPADSKSAATTVELYDMSGKLVKTFGLSDSYDIKNLAKGAYLIKVKGNGIAKALRIVKN